MTHENIRMINGQEVHCFGVWRWDSNCLVVGTMVNGDEFEEIWAEGADSWVEAIKILEPWAKRIGLVIEELTTC